MLVIDEAGMVGTRTLAPLLDAAATHGAKVVLVGDPKQLPEIQAGGVLAPSRNATRCSRSPRTDARHDETEREALSATPLTVDVDAARRAH